jgi:3-deoxy-manno-octulosonate cytidylyltransferase (CMP-KDO synthetase)
VAVATVVIPARYGSMRFPGKALANETGKPLIEHVHERAVQAESIDRVIVATDDERIRDAVRAFGGDVVMTRQDHPNGTSRIAEVADNLDAELIVNVQGDEPELDPRLIDLAVETLAAHDDCSVSTIASPFGLDEDPGNPNIVKVVADRRGRALYFSRSVIPFDRDRLGLSVVRPLKHVGLYVYRRTFLATYVELEPTLLEQVEHLEQLRVLEHGHEIAVAIADAHHHGIDTPEQYAAFVARFKGSTEQ